MLFLLILFLLIVSGGLILTGFLITDTVKNVLTILGILFFIPFSMFTATFLSMISFSSFEENKAQEIQEITGDGLVNFDILIANKDGKSYYFPCLVIVESGIYAYTTDMKMDTEKASSYVRNFLRLNKTDSEFFIEKDFNLYKEKIRGLSLVSRSDAPEILLKEEGVLRAISM